MSPPGKENNAACSINGNSNSIGKRKRNEKDMDEEISSSSSSRAEKASKREQRFHERIATLLIEKQAQKEQKNEQKEQDHGGLLLDMKEVNSIFAQASKLLFLDTEELEKAEQHNEDIQQLSKHMVEQCQTHNL